MAITIPSISTFWHGSDLTAWEILCLSSFLNQGHQVIVFSYQDNLNVPTGVSLHDASDIISKDYLFSYKHGKGKGSIAGFSDLFRYCLLYKYGGFWVDTDVICLKPFLPWDQFVVGREDSSSVNNAIIFSPKGHELVKEARDYAMELGDKVRWGDTGPKLITKLVSKYNAACQVLPENHFYPIHWKKAVEMLVLPENAAACEHKCADSQAIHLYNEMFRRACIPKAMFPPKGSYLHKLFLENKIDMPEKLIMNADMVKKLFYSEEYQESHIKYMQLCDRRIIKKLNFFMKKIGNPLF